MKGDNHFMLLDYTGLSQLDYNLRILETNLKPTRSILEHLLLYPAGQTDECLHGHLESKFINLSSYHCFASKL